MDSQDELLDKAIDLLRRTKNHPIETVEVNLENYEELPNKRLTIMVDYSDNVSIVSTKDGDIVL